MEHSETTKEWQELSPAEVECCLAAHAVALGLNWKSKRVTSTMRRIFDLGHPKIVLGYEGGKLSYCRIDQDSKAVMVVLIRQYL